VKARDRGRTGDLVLGKRRRPVHHVVGQHSTHAAPRRFAARATRLMPCDDVVEGCGTLLAWVQNIAGGLTREVKRFTSGRVFAGSFGSFRAIHARAKTSWESLCCKHLRAFVGLFIVGLWRSSNLPPSAHEFKHLRSLSQHWTPFGRFVTRFAAAIRPRAMEPLNGAPMARRPVCRRRRRAGIFRGFDPRRVGGSRQVSAQSGRWPRPAPSSRCHW
jgi:hypothetical protein